MLPLLFILSTPQERVHSLTGNIKHHPAFASKVLGNQRNLIVYLPPGYETSKRKYKVLYMNDGQNVMDGFTSFIPNQEWQADETAERLINEGVIEPLIVVGVDNGQGSRGDEYLPTAAKLGESSVGGNAKNYLKMLTTEVMPFINRTYQTKTGPSNTAMIGSSFGGIVSLYAGLTHPGTFGSVGVLSPSIWWDNREMLRRIERLETKPNLKIWLDMGTKEGYEHLLNARKVKHELIRKGWVIGRDLEYLEAAGARHNERAWSARMEPLLRFFYRK